MHAGDAPWRPSNQMGVLNCDLAKQLEATTLAARFWRLERGQASTKHRHTTQTELYVVLEGTGRMRIGNDDGVEALTLAPYSSVLVDPGEVRQVFNDTDADALWLVVGTPPELANTLEMTAEQLARMYPDGPRALPPELAGGWPSD
jgi:mannose-6-phosphate isomerase-like protein (cupin superfamily)